MGEARRMMHLEELKAYQRTRVARRDQPLDEGLPPAAPALVFREPVEVPDPEADAA